VLCPKCEPAFFAKFNEKRAELQPAYLAKLQAVRVKHFGE
jgi:hypothetical protein